mgnify:FL=1
MFNKVVLLGNLTRDIEMRYAPSGSAIGSSAIAVTRKFTASTGEKKEETCFIDITFWGRPAEVANQYLSKGSKVLIEGRLRFEQWNDQNGQARSKHSVYVENMEMLGSSPNSQGGGYSQNFANNSGANKGTSYDPYAEQAPKQNAKATKNQAQQQEKLKEIDIEDFDADNTELPF